MTMNERIGKKSGAQTRARILDMACSLFNERGFTQVATRAIAEAVGINEGNLYYYFKTKEAIALALFDRVEARATTLFGEETAAYHQVAGYVDLLAQWFAMSWSYRFLFRDIDGLIVAAPALRSPLRQLSIRTHRIMQRRLDALRDGNMLSMSDAQRDHLLTNVWIVGSYWMNYLILHRGVSLIRHQHMAWGLAQIRSLYEPYLTPEAHASVAALLGAGDVETIIVDRYKQLLISGDEQNDG